MGRHPEVKWAQRSDKIFLTVELPDAKDPKVKLEPEGKFTFTAAGYDLDLELFDKVKVEESKISTGMRNVFCVIQKAEEGWWKRLLKGEGKPPPYLKVDWNKWVDEDEENEPAANNLGGLDFDSMGGFSGFNGMGDNESDSDDEDSSELLKAGAEETLKEAGVESEQKLEETKEIKE